MCLHRKLLVDDRCKFSQNTELTGVSLLWIKRVNNLKLPKEHALTDSSERPITRLRAIKMLNELRGAR